MAQGAALGPSPRCASARIWRRDTRQTLAYTTTDDLAHNIMAVVHTRRGGSLHEMQPRSLKTKNSFPPIACFPSYFVVILSSCISFFPGPLQCFPIRVFSSLQRKKTQAKNRLTPFMFPLLHCLLFSPFSSFFISF